MTSLTISKSDCNKCKQHLAEAHSHSGSKWTAATATIQHE
ncbi:hypothetical protein AQPE_4066 [Aquipluma nitroreducens]|uniref:Uncharacterized protein n=1 Tax=Aquipluma nitroreducens TaxID=2010828 RepID=A0A5K7SE79_9BACT|nr:hypothetical protein AQPE_4066 [Aquipluma nitroreducens]